MFSLELSQLLGNKTALTKILTPHEKKQKSNISYVEVFACLSLEATFKKLFNVAKAPQET